jgi:hypothetical protein
MNCCPLGHALLLVAGFVVYTKPKASVTTYQSLTMQASKWNIKPQLALATLLACKYYPEQKGAVIKSNWNTLLICSIKHLPINLLSSA